MSNQCNNTLAGLAALALLAGTALASAQEPQDHNSAPQPKQPQTTQQMNMGPAAGKMGQSTSEQNRGTAAHKSTERATEMNKVDNAAAAKKGTAQATAQERERDGMKGLQGNASGTNVRLSDQQRTQIRTTVINAQGAPRVGSVTFDVAVGTVIPRDSIHIVPVPETLVRIEPRWRGFLYFVYEDEVIIVNPRDMRIVAVVPA
jgi:hypothetical protein